MGQSFIQTLVLDDETTPSHGYPEMFPSAQFFDWHEPSDQLPEKVSVWELLGVGSGILSKISGEELPTEPFAFSNPELTSLLVNIPEALKVAGRMGSIPSNRFRFVENGVVELGSDMPHTEDGLANVAGDYFDQLETRSGTFVFAGASEWHPRSAEIAATIARDLTATANVGSFISDSGTRGFPPHYDTFHSVIHQVTGSKVWEVSAGPIFEPGNDHTWPRLQHMFTEEDLLAGELVQFNLTAGQTVWVPPGWVHRGLAGEEGSAHVTVGIQPARWFELLEYMTSSAENLWWLRRAVPLRLGMVPGKGRRTPISEIFRQLADGFEARQDVTDRHLVEWVIPRLAAGINLEHLTSSPQDVLLSAYAIADSGDSIAFHFGDRIIHGVGAHAVALRQLFKNEHLSEVSEVPTQVKASVAAELSKLLVR